MLRRPVSLILIISMKRSATTIVCRISVPVSDVLAGVEGIVLHENPSSRFDSNYWLNTILLDPSLHVKGEEHAYETAVQGAVGGAAGVTHVASSLHTDSEPNQNVEAMRMALDAVGIESRPLWKPMHLQPVYKNNPRYVNGVSESLFRQERNENIIDCKILN